MPFRGGPEALTEVIDRAGRVLFLPDQHRAALYPRRQDCSRLVVNSPKRAAELPDVPTTLEAGYRDADLPIWIGMFAPVKTPREIVDRLHAETVKACRLPATRDKLAKTGIEPMIMSPAEFDAAGQAGDRDHGALARAAGIKPN